jgi:hypothetical protein
MLIEARIEVGDIVVDCTVAIGDLLPLNFLFIHSWLLICNSFGLIVMFMIFAGTSIYVCRKAGYHIVAMEEDEVIFKALLQPLIIENVS